MALMATLDEVIGALERAGHADEARLHRASLEAVAKAAARSASRLLKVDARLSEGDRGAVTVIAIRPRHAVQAVPEALDGVDGECDWARDSRRKADDARAPSATAAAGREARLTLHVDGACPGNGTASSRGGWAFVLSSDDGTARKDPTVVLRRSGREAGPTTNNAMELRAVEEGLRAVPEGARVEVVSDSKNVIGWMSQGWKAKAPNLAGAVASVRSLSAARDVTWRWTKGHAEGRGGDPLNAMCDALAVEAAQG